MLFRSADMDGRPTMAGVERFDQSSLAYLLSLSREAVTSNLKAIGIDPAFRNTTKPTAHSYFPASRVTLSEGRGEYILSEGIYDLNEAARNGKTLLYYQMAIEKRGSILVSCVDSVTKFPTPWDLNPRAKLSIWADEGLGGGLQQYEVTRNSCRELKVQGKIFQVLNLQVYNVSEQSIVRTMTQIIPVTPNDTICAELDNVHFKSLSFFSKVAQFIYTKSSLVPLDKTARKIIINCNTGRDRSATLMNFYDYI